MKPHLLRTSLLFALGAFLIQMAWVVSVPPFRGSDEFDHAYRADSVALGHWAPSTVRPERGRGGLLPVRPSIVNAAGPVCDWYRYTGHDNCHPVEHLPSGLVTVASGASTYNPAFYWIVGSAGSLFEGINALYAMRIVTALLCTALLGLAAANLTSWSTSRWPLAGLVVALTPVVLYSQSVVAPNGVEMASALVLWTALLGLTSAEHSRRMERRLWWGTLIGAGTLATLRQLGPLWLLLIVATVLVASNRGRIIGMVRRNRGVVTAVTVSAASLAVAGTGWAMWAGALEVESSRSDTAPAPLPGTLEQVPLWIFQSVAAFPTRGEQAPALVYASELVVGALLLGTGVRYASSRLTGAIVLSVALTFAVPFVLTLATYSTAGPQWQGRYMLPYSFGVVLLAATALDRVGLRHRWVPPLVLASSLAIFVAHCTSVLSVYLKERDNPAMLQNGEWPGVDPWVPVMLSVLGACFWLLAFSSARNPQGPRPST